MKNDIDFNTRTSLCLQGMLVHLGVRSTDLLIPEGNTHSRFSAAAVVFIQDLDNYELSSVFAQAAEHPGAVIEMVMNIACDESVVKGGV